MLATVKFMTKYIPILYSAFHWKDFPLSSEIDTFILPLK